MVRSIFYTVCERGGGFRVRLPKPRRSSRCGEFDQGPSDRLLDQKTKHDALTIGAFDAAVVNAGGEVTYGQVML